MMSIIIVKINIIIGKNFIKSSLNPSKFNNPLIFEIEIPTVRETAAAATEFLTL